MAKRKRRTFTAEFKAKVVLEALRGETSQAELCRRYNLSEDQVSEWKQQFLENAVTLFEWVLRTLRNALLTLSSSLDG